RLCATRARFATGPTWSSLSTTSAASSTSTATTASRPRTPTPRETAEAGSRANSGEFSLSDADEGEPEMRLARRLGLLGMVAALAAPALTVAQGGRAAAKATNPINH